MSDNPFTLIAFAEWCESKGEETFAYCDMYTCACSRYAFELGMEYRVPNASGEFPGKAGFWAQIEWLASNVSNVGQENQETRYADLAQLTRQHIILE